jgi:hypothetical protein
LDTLHSVIFYAFAAVTVAGGLLVALLDGRARVIGLGLAAVGVAGLLADLGAGFAAPAALVGLGACALLLRPLGPTGPVPIGLDRQLGEALAGLAFLALVYVAFRGAHLSAGSVDFLFVGGFLFAAGAFLVARRCGLPASLAGVPLLLGGAAIDLGAVAGQEFAIVAAVFALVVVALGTRLAAAETSR